MDDTNHVAFFRENDLSSTKYETGTSVDEIVEVRAAMDNKEKNPNATSKPILPIELNSSGNI